MEPSCAPSYKIVTYQTSVVLVDPDSREKQFTVLKYHVTCNNRCAHKLQEHMITCGIQTHERSPFQAHLPGSPATSLP